MNTVIIIGNGFDLAHGLKTRYSDFILWYFNQIMDFLNRNGTNTYSDSLISFNFKGRYKIQYVIESQEKLKKIIDSGDYEIRFTCGPFLNKIVRKILEFNWVDIEYEYYTQLEGLYKAIKLQGTREKKRTPIKT